MLFHDVFLKPDPPTGLGMSCAAIDQNSHAQISVSSRRLKVELLDDKNQPVRDTGDIEAEPDAPACEPAVLEAE